MEEGKSREDKGNGAVAGTAGGKYDRKRGPSKRMGR